MSKVIRLQPSRLFAYYVWGIAIIAIGIFTWVWWISVYNKNIFYYSLIIIINTSLFFSFKNTINYYCLRLSKTSIIAFSEKGFGLWILETKTGKKIPVYLSGEAYRGPRFITLSFKTLDKKTSYSILITKDAVGPCIFRELQSYLWQWV